MHSPYLADTLVSNTDPVAQQADPSPQLDYWEGLECCLGPAMSKLLRDSRAGKDCEGISVRTGSERSKVINGAPGRSASERILLL